MRIQPVARETIAAVATPPGRGGIGIVRVSGVSAQKVVAAMAPPVPPPRTAALRQFFARGGTPIDRGLVLFFPAPHSYTGEDVLELQAHGAPAVLEALLAAAVAAGARPARPGEFTERAFLNGKLDLAQAEAVADLIEAGSAVAARAALASLDGRFSRELYRFGDELMRLRVEVEAGLDFPDDDVGNAGAGLRSRLHRLCVGLENLTRSATVGQRLTEGFVCVLAGAPNVGKSSLLNALAGAERAIVTEVPGTTRDPVEVDVLFRGLALRLVDTAGLREAGDRLEAEGVRRARARAEAADLVLEVRDDSAPAESVATGSRPRLVVVNKIDLSRRSPGEFLLDGEPAVAVSAETGAGLPELVEHLSAFALGGAQAEGAKFSARRRHLEALDRATAGVAAAAAVLDAGGELAAEELTAAQHALGEITGAVATEDLLGAIFSSFCIGK